MVVMVLAVALLSVAGVWGAVLLVVVSLCRGAQAGDRQLQDRYREADEPSPTILAAPAERSEAGYLLGIDLSAHGRPTRTPTSQMLGIAEAAAALGVEPEVLVAWEARYGYPACGLSATGQGLSYAQAEISALAVGLRAGLSVASAIIAARAMTRQDDAIERDPWCWRDLPA